MAEVLGKNVQENANLLLLGQDITKKKKKKYTYTYGLVVNKIINVFQIGHSITDRHLL